MNTNTQTSNMSIMKVNTFMKAFMVKVKDTLDEKAYDAILVLWEGKENQEDLTNTFKRGRKLGSKTKKLKDKNAPKRAKSAYIYYCSDFRAAAKAELGDDATVGQVGKELGRLWHEAKYANKVKKYINLAAQDKERYGKEMDVYVRPSDEELLEQTKSKRKKKSRKSSSKKKNKSAYMFFCSEERSKIKEEFPEMTPREVMRELGRRWKEAKKGDTSKWDEMAKKNKIDAVESSEEENKIDAVESSEEENKIDAVESSEEENKMSEEDESFTIQSIRAEIEVEKPKEKPKKKSSKKKKKRVYASSLWKKTHKDEIAKETGLTGSDLIKALGKRWKAMSPEEHEEWKEKARNFS